MQIASKRHCYELLQKGFFGNKLRIWNSIEEIQESGYTRSFSMRYKGDYGGDFCEYDVPFAEIMKIQNRWISKGAKGELITFNESAPDSKLLIQGHLANFDGLMYLFYSLEKTKMREAMKHGNHADGLIVKLLLEHYLMPPSYEDMRALLDMFPNHAIEFSTYSCCLGDIPGRNTIIWEVRNY